MTKKIRIENADTGTYKVRAYVEDLVDGKWVRTSETALDFPTALGELYIHSTRRIVVEELP